MIHFFSQVKGFKFTARNACRKWIQSTVKELGCAVGEINFVFLADEDLRKINFDFLARDYFTDVISFSMSEEERLISGDVYISIDRVKDNSLRYRQSFDQELNRVIIHGLLHLTGEEDNTVNEKKRMRRLEAKYLDKLLEIDKNRAK
jgi:rRNA maturation RNase YbeY